MRYEEFGSTDSDVILLLHGGGLSWWNYREEASLLKDEFRVILPVLDGHAGSGRPFTSIEDNASHLLSFIDEKCGGKVLFAGGLSLGGQILLEMLCQRPDFCRYAIVESASVLPSKLTNALIGPSVRSSFGLIKNERFARLQFSSLHMREELFDDYYRDTCRIQKQDMVAFMKASTSYALKPSFKDTDASVHVYAGEKETKEILRSAEAVVRARPSCGLHVLSGLRHGEFSLNHPDMYADAVRNIVLRKQEET